MFQSMQCCSLDAPNSPDVQACIVCGVYPTNPTVYLHVCLLACFLQGLVSHNSRLKAQLQGRDAELAAQGERLEQQGHDLACCEEMLQVRMHTLYNPTQQYTLKPWDHWGRHSCLLQPGTPKALLH